MDEILQAQHASMETVLTASRNLVSAKDSFSIEALEALLEMRGKQIETLSELDRERSALSGTDSGGGQNHIRAAIVSVVKELGAVDRQLQDLMRSKQIKIINSMASMRNRVNFNNLTDQKHTGNRVLNVVR